jgi:hypothetical protein
MDAADVVRAYKDLAHVERDFRWVKGDDVEVRPFWRRRAARIRAHLLICLLAAHLAWQLRTAWAPLAYTDAVAKDPGRDPVRPQRRSGPADAKASHRQTADGRTPRSFRGLLDHLDGLRRLTVEVATPAKTHRFVQLTEPTADQAEAFRLLGAPIPQTLAVPPPARRARSQETRPAQP